MPKRIAKTADIKANNKAMKIWLSLIIKNSLFLYNIVRLYTIEKKLY